MKRNEITLTSGQYLGNSVFLFIYLLWQPFLLVFACLVGNVSVIIQSKIIEEVAPFNLSIKNPQSSSNHKRNRLLKSDPKFMLATRQRLVLQKSVIQLYRAGLITSHHMSRKCAL